ncbi:S9 family peptidase [Marilutibacter alkalisoli]|nr:alpha/beta fold hydrolase [Lysobacter alkalisoli]
MNPIPTLLGALACLVLSCSSAATVRDDAAALRAATAVESARSPAPHLSRAEFVAVPPLSSVTLSPDGRHVAYLVDQGGDARSLWVLPTAGGHARNLLPRTTAQQARWSQDGKWLFLQGARFVSSLALQSGTGIRIELGGTTRRETMMVDPSQPAALIVREELRSPARKRWRIVRIDTRGRRTVLREDSLWIHDLTLDAHGNLQFLMRYDGRDAHLIERMEPNGRLREVLRWDNGESGSLLAGTARDELYLRSNFGTDLKGVMRLDPDGTLHTVHQDPRGEADLDQLATHPLTHLPMIASYRSIEAASYGISDAEPHVDAIRARFPHRVLGISIGAGPGAQWLVSSLGSSPDARWYLYDPRSRGFRRILAEFGRRSRLNDAVSAREIPFAYTASDGMRVRGFLLLPPGADPARVPLVAQVHGGPFSHNEDGYGRYDRIAQFLVNRGYAVFQPNFRGSTGHGRRYALAARGDFGNGRVQQDIVDGVRYLLAHGIGDAGRVGIVGHSFGGYAVLLGVTFQPELFKIGVAGSPPSDFAWLMRWNVDEGELGTTPGFDLEQMLRHNGIDIRDAAAMARLSAQSPLAHAGMLRRPLALVAGGQDERVPIRAVTHYAATLSSLGKPATLLVEPDGAHSPGDPIPREGYMYVLETMLHAHLGGDAPEAPSSKLRAYLDRNLRLVGPEFAGTR